MIITHKARYNRNRYSQAQLDIIAKLDTIKDGNKRYDIALKIFDCRDCIHYALSDDPSRGIMFCLIWAEHSSNGTGYAQGHAICNCHPGFEPVEPYSPQFQLFEGEAL